MMCVRCEELQERVAYLESELGIQDTADIQDRLMRALRRPDAKWTKANGAARLIARLYAAKGKPVTTLQLLEATPAKAIYDERNAEIVKVWICFGRKTLGKDAIVTVWGFGYRLSDTGMAQVTAILDGVA